MTQNGFGFLCVSPIAVVQDQARAPDEAGEAHCL